MRLTAFLIILTLASALSVVSLQHQSRNLVTAIEREQVRTHALDVEWGQLQIESSTWAAHARVEKIARERLGMVTPAKDALPSVDPSVLR
ncbi:MAG TPA: cell division protein FtsL [Rhodocyclaceae bacterium]|nr:cell division protein FtsL [Rhodocyclaceae bacterium]